MGTPNYTAWSEKKTFHVGDTLLFVYNNTFHNVVEVKKSDYDACTEKSAIATYTTGNDSITIKTAGTHYYLCGFPGHCSIGQKVEIAASAAKGTAPASSAAPSPASSGSDTGSASAPAPQGEGYTPELKRQPVAVRVFQRLHRRPAVLMAVAGAGVVALIW
ncbi:putative blue copper protein [Iris pallida]|uniref:Blue copper protein n=1 Tax=Iris pallida TaxID=29817 RepID=A0AAX6EIG3_IRIPA|nr:putative blue copper protein [Iris pallida]